MKNKKKSLTKIPYFFILGVLSLIFSYCVDLLSPQFTWSPTQSVTPLIFIYSFLLKTEGILSIIYNIFLMIIAPYIHKPATKNILSKLNFTLIVLFVIELLFIGVTLWVTYQGIQSDYQKLDKLCPHNPGEFGCLY